MKCEFETLVCDASEVSVPMRLYQDKEDNEIWILQIAHQKYTLSYSGMKLLAIAATTLIKVEDIIWERDKEG